VLYYLKDEESQELKEAQKTLDDMELAYEKALLSLPVPDYSEESRSIREAKEDLAALKKQRDEISGKDAAVKTAQAAVDTAQDKVDSLTDQQTELADQIADLSGNSLALKSYKTAVTEAEKVLKKTQEDLANFKGVGDEEAALENIRSLQQNLDDQLMALSRLKEDMTYRFGPDASRKQFEDAVTLAREAYNSAAIQPDVDQELLNKLSAELQNAEQQLTAFVEAERGIQDKEFEIQRTQEKLSTAQNEYNSIAGQAAQKAALQMAVDNAQSNYDRAQEAYDSALESFSAGLKSQLESLKSQLKAANRELKDAQENLQKAQSESGISSDDADKAILAKEREIEAAQTALAKKQEADLLEAKKNNLDIEAQEKQLEAQRELVKKYKSQGTGATVTSQYSGIVSSLSAVAGDTISTGSTVAVVEVVEKGYSMEFPVTNDQAKLIKVGDQASINSWWYSDVTVTVAQMKNDPANPGKGRIVVCDVRSDSEGGVTVGQSLSIVLGERGATYEIVVPNSAIREDSNGKFVLVVESKSSPLGNRYIATRADITVVASDDNSSAIQGALYGNEFVITTSTKPIEAGQQVRLVEN
ncbi:MAG: hypothetical protein PUD44_01185, partial [Clostridiaceae bacterium]|nr:hypothetical protein [Clostridiaceae bacterium]